MAISLLSYNHPELTARAVRSVLPHHPSQLVHLIHNGSREECVTSLKEQFPQIKHFILPSNKGYTGGVNFCLESAFEFAEWAFLITNDCELEQIGSPPSFPALVAPRIEIRKTGRVDSLGGALNLQTGRLSHCRTLIEWENETHRYIPGTAFLVHQKLFKQIGRFDERLHTYWEDVDFSRRAEESGFQLLVDPSFVLRHGVGKTCHKDPHYTTYLYQRNRRFISRGLAQTFAGRMVLEANLWTDYFRGSYRLAKAKRWMDLRRLATAHFKPFV